MITSIEPSTGKELEAFSPLSPEYLEKKLAASWAAFQRFRLVPLEERARRMLKAAEILESDQQKYGALMTHEMGKLLQDGAAEARKCAWACRFYAENAARFLADEAVKTDASSSYVCYQPLGPVLAVMPWNFPFWQVFRFAAPALMAGNTGLLKHASNVPQCALAIEEIFNLAGFEEGVFQTLLLGNEQVAGVIADPRVVAVTLTGSEKAGSLVASEAGKAIKKTVLELGGSDPFIVMPSADFDQAVATAVRARVINSGQSCIAAKRFIIHESIYERFEQAFVEKMDDLVVGDPMDPRTQVGPLATRQILEGLEEQVRLSVEAGAQLLMGGRRLERPGFFYQPTVLAGIPENAPAFSQELFGPVASLFRAENVDEALRLANATPFGLASSVWTKDPAEQERFIRDLEAGQVFINGMVASDPRLPFGGVKRSGYGRELSQHGIREFVNAKTVWIKGAAGENVPQGYSE